MVAKLKQLKKIILWFIVIFAVLIVAYLNHTKLNIFGREELSASTDTQMIEYFEKNETLFEELNLMIICDQIRYYPLYASEIRDGVSLPISVDRAAEYDSLMGKLQIERFHNSAPLFNPALENNSIISDYFAKGDATWGIEKGFEYVFDRTKEKGENKEFTDRELYDAATERHENCILYKKINDKWSLFITYDRYPST